MVENRAALRARGFIEVFCGGSGQGRGGENVARVMMGGVGREMGQGRGWRRESAGRSAAVWAGAIGICSGTFRSRPF